MKSIISAFLTAFVSASAFAHGTTLKTETIEELPKTETKNFCAKGNAEEAEKECDKWLKNQLKSLGDKVLTSNCSSGDMTTDTNCLFKAQGEVTWVMKKNRIETERH